MKVFGNAKYYKFACKHCGNLKGKELCKRHTDLLAGKIFPHHPSKKNHPWAYPLQH